MRSLEFNTTTVFRTIPPADLMQKASQVYLNATLVIAQLPTRVITRVKILRYVRLWV
jgi:hypothetical protein